MRQLIRRVWYAIRQGRLDADLSEEIEFHRVMKQRELEEGGLDPAVAPFATRRALGSTALAKDRARDVWQPRWSQGIGQDVRLAIRSLRATPVVTIVAVLSLALGIGANTAIFSLVNSLLLRMLPVVNPQQLVTIYSPRMIELGASGAGWSYPVWQQIQQRTELFDGAVAWSPQRFNLAQGGETQFVDGLWVSGAFFRVLGVPALLGHTFTDADDQRGGGPDGAVAVISYRFWQQRFSGSVDVVGHTLTVENLPFTIVGVTPPDFFGADVGRTFDVAVPLGNEPLVRGRETRLDLRAFYWLTIMGRLRGGQTLDAANRTLRGVQSQIREATLPDIPKAYQDQYLSGREGFTLVPTATGNSLLRGRYQRSLLVIQVVAGLVLLIACANITNVLLAHATSQRHEHSVRRALGASRWRLGRQLFTESAMLAAVGAALGSVIAAWGSRALVRQLSTQTNGVFLDLPIDGRMLGFTIGVTVVTALFFGVVPALRASHVAPIDALKEHGRGTAGDARTTITQGLIVAQVALSVVLVVAAGLFIRSFTSLTKRDLGFERGRVLVVTVNARRATVAPAQRLQFFERVSEGVRGLSGVADVALSTVTPVQGGGMVVNIDVSGGVSVPMSVLGGIANGYANAISPDWFRTFGIPLLSGRGFSDRDRKGTPLVAIVNQTLVRDFLQGANPLGHMLTLGLPRDKPIEIVGVVGDSVYGSLRESVPPTVYTPLQQFDAPPAMETINLNVRSSGGEPGLLTKSIVAALGGVSPQLALTFRPLTDQVNASLVQERALAMLSGFFGGVALLLAGLGLYGVTSYAVTRRRPEFGIRMALGAAPGRVVRLVLSQLFVLVALGITIGGVVSLWASRFIAELLYGLEARDPTTLAGAAVVLAGVAGLAAWLPAWRASRIDPAVVLRYE